MCASVISLFGWENESKLPKTVQLISEPQGGEMSEFFHSYLPVCKFLLARWVISTLNSNAIKLEKASMDKSAWNVGDS